MMNKVAKFTGKCDLCNTVQKFDRNKTLLLPRTCMLRILIEKCKKGFLDAGTIFISQ